MNAELKYNSCEQDLCYYHCEMKAYKNLQKYDVCETDHISHFYESFEELDSAYFFSHLNLFKLDKLYLNIILMKYLSNTLQLNCQNYSKKQMQKTIISIKAIYQAYMKHCDLYFKNILIVSDSSERVV